MKMRILFVMNNLQCGGAEKSLISLFETLDYTKYEVDLLLFKHDGIFMNRIPKQVNVLDEPDTYKYFDMSIQEVIKNSIRKGQLGIVWSRLCAGFIFRSEKNRARCEQRVWKYMSRALLPLDKHYDVAVGYLEKNPVYYCVDKVTASQKIGFIHNDYDKLGMDPEIDLKYFDQLTDIVTVSTECARVLMQRFPMYTEKIQVIHNIVSPTMINNMALDNVDMKSGVRIVSVGRFNDQKGFDMAIEACRKIMDSGYQITWYIVGEGEEREKLTALIQQNNLQDIFILLGIKENPYPYIKAADIYVQPSRFEGKSIAIDEAKILHKPILVTNFSTAKDQITHEENGLIVDMNPESIYRGIKALIDDKPLRNQLINNLKKEVLGTESEINKLYELINQRKGVGI